MIINTLKILIDHEEGDVMSQVLCLVYSHIFYNYNQLPLKSLQMLNIFNSNPSLVVFSTLAILLCLALQ